MSHPTHSADPVHIIVDSIKSQLNALVAVAGHGHHAHEEPVPKVLTPEQKAKKAEKNRKQRERQAAKAEYDRELERRYKVVEGRDGADKAMHYKTEHSKLLNARNEHMKSINKAEKTKDEKEEMRKQAQTMFLEKEKLLHNALNLDSMFGLPDNLWNPNTYMRAGDSLKYL